MTTVSGTPAIADLERRMLEVLPTDLETDERLLAMTLYRELARGVPVRGEQLAETTGLAAARVEAILSAWHGVYRDDDGRIIGFWGLAIPEMRHAFEVGGRRLYTWCAWDTLFIPAVLGTTADIESRCPVTDQPVRLRVSPDAIESLEPSTAVLSFREIDPDGLEDVQSSFCHFIHFFAAEKAAAQWTAVHPGTFLLSVEQGFELGKAKNRAQFGSLP